ncbi:MAG: hypothetical protein V4633_24180 [Pseudomonadota bacterium]
MRAILILALLAAALPARADGLADLKAALVRGAVHTPCKAQLDTRTARKTGEGKDAEEEQGSASVMVDDGVRGMSLVYGKDILARIELEQRAKVKDPNSKTPTLMALAELGPDDVLLLVSSAQAMQRTLDKAAFKGERADTYQGKPVRVLSFEIPMSTLGARDLKYTKKFEAMLDVWVAPDGTPLASRMRQSRSGRAFVVVTFDAAFDDQRVYGLVGERLVTLRRELAVKASGAGEREDTRIVTTLSPQQ